MVEKSLSATAEIKSKFLGDNSQAMTLRTREAMDTPLSARSSIVANHDPPTRLDCTSRIYSYRFSNY